MTVKLDGKPFSYFGIELISPADHPMAPQTEDITLKVPGRDGLYHFGSTFGERNFSFECGVIREIDETEMQRKLREFTAFLLDAYGKPREIKITFDYEPEKYYLVKFAGQISASRFYSIGTFTLPFTAFDPYAYAEMNAYDSPSNHEYGTGLEYDSGLFYDNPKSFQWTYPKHFSGVYNHGFQHTHLNLTITGKVTNPKITNQTTGETILLPSLSLSTDSLVVSTKDFTVKKNGVNAMNSYSGEFLYLVSGENSLMFEGESPSATVNYEWKHRFI